MQLLGTKRSKEVLDVSTLVRGHLSPDGDFLWAPHQWATYFYANVAPQFSSINGGHWKVVENLARKLASQVRLHLQHANRIDFPVPATAQSTSPLPLPSRCIPN